jgi:transcriptional regulator with XRE-family HTH domain
MPIVSTENIGTIVVDRSCGMAKIDPTVLRDLRRKKQWSQEELAEKSKINKQTISRLERGKQYSTRSYTIRQLASVLDVEWAVLLGDVLNLDNQRESGSAPSKSVLSVNVQVAGNLLQQYARTEMQSSDNSAEKPTRLMTNNGWTFWTKNNGRTRMFSIAEPDRLKARDLLTRKLPDHLLVSEKEIPAAVIQMMQLPRGKATEWVAADSKGRLTPQGSPIS